MRAEKTDKGEGEPMVVAVLREAIRSSGRPLLEIAREAKIGTSSLSRFMRGERGLSFEVAGKVCDVLGLQLKSSGKRGKPK